MRPQDVMPGACDGGGRPRNTWRQLRSRLPAGRKLCDCVRQLVVRTLRKTIDDDIITQGAAIAFYTIFSLAPLLILIVSLASLFLSKATVISHVHSQLADLAGADLAGHLDHWLKHRSFAGFGSWTTLVAGAAVVFGATTVIAQLKRTLNRIWKVESIAINSVWHFALNRVISIGVIVLLSLLFVASHLAEIVIGLVASFLAELLPGVQLDLYNILSQGVATGFSIVFFTLLYKVLPDVNARWIDLLVGAAVTTGLFLLGKHVIGLYFSASGVNVAYRAAGSLVVFVIWVFYNVQTILVGAVFTQVYTDLFGGTVTPYRFVTLKETLPQ